MADNLLNAASIVLTATAYDDGKVLCVKPSEPPYGDLDFSRNSSATRVNAQGLVEDVQILSGNLVTNGDFSEEGAELIVNGDFSNGSTDWSFATGWSIGTDKAIFDDTTTNRISQTGLSITSGKSYKINFTIADCPTTAHMTIYDSGGSDLILPNENYVNGSYTRYYTATTNETGVSFWGNTVGDTFSITNISIKEVGIDWTLGTGWSIGDDKAICDGTNGSRISQDVGFQASKTYRFTIEVSDYTSGSIGFQYYNGGYVSFDSMADGIKTTEFTITGTPNGFLYIRSTNFIGSITNLSLIEITSDTNLPRINYDGFSYDGSGAIIPNSGCGSWLWEPQSTNLVTYSEDFSQWGAGAGIAIQSGYLAPDGNNTAYKVTKTGTSQPYLTYSLGLTATTTRSIYARTVSGTGTATLLTHNSNTNNTFTITEEWQRFDVNISNSVGVITFYAADFRGSGTLTEYLVWGANATNDQSYATSYIPTEGTTVTRNQDLCTNGGSAALINSTEGVLYAEIAALVDDGTFRLLGFSDGTSANRVYIGYSSADKITCSFQVSSSVVYSFDFTTDITINSKLALKYKQNDFALWVNGVEVNSQLSGNTFSIGTLTQMQFTSATTSSNFFGKTKCLAVWKTALTDLELEQLSSWASFISMAKSLNYTII